jgi:hypothetical protein
MRMDEQALYDTGPMMALECECGDYEEGEEVIGHRRV